MTLIEQNPVSHLLDGMLKCRNCGTPMETAGESFNEAPKYVCATGNFNCNTPEIEAEPFNRLMVKRVIDAILDEENTSRVTDIVSGEAVKALEARDEDRRAIFELQRKGPDMLNLHRGTPLVDAEALRLTDGEKEYFQAMEAEYRGRWERIGPYSNVVENPREIQKYALDPDTYLRPSNIRTTRAIMESAVADIFVGLGSATINYRLPLPHGGGAGTRSSDEISL